MVDAHPTQIDAETPISVLLIEDDPDHAFLLEHRLGAESRTFTVDHVDDLRSTAGRLANERYDVIVLDLGLPDSAGLDTVEQLVALDPKCAIVVMTGASDADIASRAFALGVNDYLPKSRAATELLPRVLVHAIERESVKQAVAAQLVAEQANRAKSAFLSRISHEFRTPLNAIMGFARLLESEATSDDDLEATGIIVKASEHLLTLINDVLELSRIEARELSLSFEPIVVGEVIDEAIGLIRGQFASADVSVSLGDVGGQHLYGDRQRVRQVVINLLSNAAKYGPSDGPIIVEAALRSDSIEIAVIDEGPGIAPNEVDALFAPFERLGNAGAETDGLGLGLTVSRELVTAMHGEIGVDSLHGQGSTFWFRLPIAPSVPATD